MCFDVASQSQELQQSGICARNFYYIISSPYPCKIVTFVIVDVSHGDIKSMNFLVARDGKVGLGCVPLQGGEDVLALAQHKLMQVIDQLGVAGIPAQDLIGRLFVMPVASLGQIDRAVAESVVTTTCRLADMVSRQLQTLVAVKE